MEILKVPQLPSMASMTKQQTQSVTHSNGPSPSWTSSDIYGKLAGDVAAATMSATLVTPTVTLIDR